MDEIREEKEKSFLEYFFGFYIFFSIFVKFEEGEFWGGGGCGCYGCGVCLVLCGLVFIRRKVNFVFLFS